MKRIIFSLSFIAFTALTISSCLRKAPDAPADLSHVDPNLKVTHTISQLLAMNKAFTYTTGGPTYNIDSDIVIKGVVTANDISGNIYKQIFIDDSSAGLSINIDQAGLYNDFPVGRKVYIKCKGLTLGYNAGTPTLGMAPDPNSTTINRITQSFMSNYIIKADVGHVVPIFNITMADAASNMPIYYNRLVNIAHAQFVDEDITYAQPNGNTLRDITLDCSAGSPTISLYNSNYANFASQTAPKGAGTIMGIYSIYTSAISGKQSPQLIIRDVTDVNFNGTGCRPELITIDSLRKLYPGTGTFTLPSVKIRGIVISDIDNKNSSTGSFIVEDASQKGIMLYVSGSNAFKLGDSISANLTGGTLQIYKNSLEASTTSASKAITLASGKSIDPIVLTLSQLNANFTKYESVLVKILNGVVSPAGTYGTGTKTLNDGTGNINLYTATAALFANDSVITTAKTYTGIATPYTSGNELKMRNLNDVK